MNTKFKAQYEIGSIKIVDDHRNEIYVYLSIGIPGVNKSFRTFSMKVKKDKNRIVGEFNINNILMHETDDYCTSLQEMEIFKSICREVFNNLKEMDLEFLFKGYGEIECVEVS
jgi:hypothetical protein